jgi:DMSO/TMAO reductase YedYZ molybdopterin-dependent catalytic subunit
MDGLRRSLFGRLVGGSLAVSLLGLGVGRTLSSEAASSGAGQALPESSTDGLAIGDGADTMAGVPSAEELANRIEPAPGTRPELTDNDDFYRIDINTRPVVLQESEWQLEVHGLIDEPRQFTLKELMAYPAITQPVTMSCISNRVGGDLIGTSQWTGFQLGAFMQELGVSPQATALLVEGACIFLTATA